jgi:Ni/Co efflux regulator RcnB
MLMHARHSCCRLEVAHCAILDASLEPHMIRILAAVALAAALVVPVATAQEAGKAPAAKAKAAAPAPKVGKDQKVCRHRFPDGKSTTWVCQKDQPCCAWDEIRYVKCGNTITRCL